jgi:hypothetical protein
MRRCYKISQAFILKLVERKLKVTQLLRGKFSSDRCNFQITVQPLKCYRYLLTFLFLFTLHKVLRFFDVPVLVIRL